MSAIPLGHPAIPAEVSIDDLVAIVTVHDPEAVKANRNSVYHKTQLLSQRPGRITRGSIEGCHVFLHKIGNQACYSMGRADSLNGEGELRKRDVYLTDKQAAIQHLLPVRASNAWRIHNECRVEAIVNGVLIQCSSACGREDTERLPCAIYLRQGIVNRVTIGGLQVDVWLLKTAREAYLTEIEPIQSIKNSFAHRTEPWAQRDLFLLREQVSTNTHRVLHRFTGERLTAKVFRDVPNPWKSRADEFEKFGKDKVDASIVRYLAMVSIDNMPAVITDTRDGLVPYAAMQSEIPKMHPGHRFLIAAKLQRRLLSALDFLHFHGTTHGNVTPESVLIRLVDRKISAVLLVGYAAATSVPFGTEMSRPAMLEDGRAAMEIVEACCNIWQLRNKPTRDAESDVMLIKKIAAAQDELNVMKRVVNDYLARGGDKYADKNRRILLLVEQKAYDLKTIQNCREHNAKRVAIADCQQSDIDNLAKDWAQTQPPFGIGEMTWMHLSLGHPYFDNLTNELRYNRWESTPREICTQFRTLAGPIEEPWQSLPVSKLLSFEQRDGQFAGDRILMWIASCCEFFPEWRTVLESECSRCLPQYGQLINADDLLKLRVELYSHGVLLSSIDNTFEKLLAPAKESLRIVHCKALYSIMLHVPSRMFNLTQLHRLASPQRFAACVQEPNTRCDTFIEVRGEPSLQGCYASVALLPYFARQLGLSLPEPPEVVKATPMYDPADFSQVPAGRIVLARTGLIAFASMIRDGNQCVFHAPRIPNTVDVLPEATFLATYFGNMKIIPDLSERKCRYTRPAHWSKFKTAEEQEIAADLRQRRIATPNRLSTQRSGNLQDQGHVSQNRYVTPGQLPSVGADESRLAQLLKEREFRRAEAHPTTKRNPDVQDEELNSPSAKRTCTSNGPVAVTALQKKPELSETHVNMIVKRLADMADGNGADVVAVSPEPQVGADQTITEADLSIGDFDFPYSVQEGDFDLDADWKKVEEWVAQLTAEEAQEKDPDQDSPIAEGQMTIFRIAAPSAEDSDATVAESIDSEVLKKHRAATKAVSAKEKSVKMSFRKSMAEAKAKSTTASSDHATQTNARGDSQTLARAWMPITPTHTRPADTTIASIAQVPSTPLFSSPIPLVSDWLSGIRDRRGTNVPDPSLVSRGSDATVAKANADKEETPSR